MKPKLFKEDEFLNKRFAILAGVAPYQAIVVQTNKDDIVFNLLPVAQELQKLQIEGAILFDRKVITGDAKDRFSYNIIYNGEFLFRGFRVLNSETEREFLKKNLAKFHQSLEVEN